MKKVIALIGFFCTISVGALMAQPPGGGNFDPAKMKERQLQQLKESDLKLTDAQADSVVSINMEMRQQMRGLRDLSDDQRQAKMKELNDYRLKRWTEALKDEALAKRVAEFYEKQRAARMNGGAQRQQ
jgi:hypothetical protein